MDKKNKINLSSLSENSQEENPKVTEELRVHGWENARQAADDIYLSLHRSLLNGNLVFAYKGTAAGTNLYQIVVVQEVNQFSGNLLNSFAVGITTHGFSALLPHVPLSYLEEDVVTDLINYKVGKEIINIYQRILNEYRNV